MKLNLLFTPNFNRYELFGAIQLNRSTAVPDFAAGYWITCLFCGGFAVKRSLNSFHHGENFSIIGLVDAEINIVTDRSG